ARGTWAARMHENASVQWSDLVRYVRDPSRGLPLHAMFLAILLAVFLAGRRQVHRARSSSDGAPSRLAAFHRPYAAPLLVPLCVLSSPFSIVPQSVRNAAQVLMLLAALRLVRPSLDPRPRLVAYAVIALFAADNVRKTLGGVSMLEQAVLVLEMLVGI